MSFPGNGRLKLFLGIFCGIILLHVLVIALITNSAQVDTADGSGKAPSAEKQQKKNQSASSGKSFWQRLFGGGEKKQKEVKTPEKKPEPPAPVYRYRKLSADKNFGAPFSFIYAQRGKLPASMVPGDISRSAILVDMNTRRVLWEKNSRQPVPIASMSKMMTILLTMEHLEKTPMLSINTPVPISRDVFKLPIREGIVWLDPRETLPLSDLLKCTAIKSANDAALQIALLVSGDEQKFVSMMNRRAVELGMTNTKFINAHGLPTKKRDQSLSSAHDMVRLGERMLEYPVIMGYFRTSFTSIREGNKKTIIRNTNRLIRKDYSNAEGMKTGYTKKAGFCLTFSVKRDGRRLMGCVTGFPTARERDRFCKNLIDWAFDGCPESYPASQKVVYSGKKTRRAKRSR